MKPPRVPGSIPGTFDGSKYSDLRVLMPPSAKEELIRRGIWDAGFRVRYYDHSCSFDYRQTTGGRQWDKRIKFTQQHGRVTRWTTDGPKLLQLV